MKGPQRCGGDSASIFVTLATCRQQIEHLTHVSCTLLIPQGRNCHCPVVQMGKLRHGAVKTLAIGRCQSWDWTQGYTSPSTSPGGVDEQMGEVQGATDYRLLGNPGGLPGPRFPLSEMEASGPSAWTQVGTRAETATSSPRGPLCAHHGLCPASLPFLGLLGPISFWRNILHPNARDPGYGFRNWEMKPWTSKVSSARGWGYICFCFFLVLSAHLDFLS